MYVCIYKDHRFSKIRVKIGIKSKFENEPQDSKVHERVLKWAKKV